MKILDSMAAANRVSAYKQTGTHSIERKPGWMNAPLVVSRAAEKHRAAAFADAEDGLHFMRGYN